MPYRFDEVHRLVPVHGFDDPAGGVKGEVADPAWFLGRQWQLGEHQGEDAASPVRVEYRASLTPVDPVDHDPRLDPGVTPAEAIVEAEPDDFWTPGRRVALGRQVERAAAAAGQPLPTGDPALRLAGLPVPYDVLDGSGFDGRALHDRRAALHLDAAWFEAGGQRPPDPGPRDLWDYAELAYDADFTAGGTTLRLRRHDGGELDWYSVDAAGPVATPGPLPAPVSVLATRVSYPGAPNPRWWQLEDPRADLGAYPPDRAHFPTLLLLELVASHSDDWFTFPVEAAAGQVVTLREAVVVDDFGDRWPLAPPGDGWTLFAVAGLDQRSLVVWPTAATPLAGPVLDQVDFGVDEDANLLWAVERRVAGRDLPTPPRPTALTDPAAATGGQAVDAGAQPVYRYQASTEVPPFWHPYLVDRVNGRRRLVQGRLADLSGPDAGLMPEPVSDLLLDPASGGHHPVHQVEPAAIPSDGVQIERRHLLGRRTDGQPVLWAQRRRVPLAAPPILRLQFDTFSPA